jgi:sulfite exporter TauE/SafE
MEALLTHCGSLFIDHGSLYLAFLLGGLTGGFTHCLSMCGPFVACERMCASKHCSKPDAFTNASGLKYHLGRMTTYGVLGFIVALLSKQIAATSWWPIVSSVMLAAAGGLFLLSCLRSCVHGSHDSPSSKLTYIRGVLLGFMPCGLLYAALMMAATLTNPLSAMVAMWIFTLGTIPALLIASGGAELLSRKWQHVMQNIGRAMMAFNGVSLLFMAARIIK